MVEGSPSKSPWILPCIWDLRHFRPWGPLTFQQVDGLVATSGSSRQATFETFLYQSWLVQSTWKKIGPNGYDLQDWLNLGYFPLMVLNMVVEKGSCRSILCQYMSSSIFKHSEGLSKTFGLCQVVTHSSSCHYWHPTSAAWWITPIGPKMEHFHPHGLVNRSCSLNFHGWWLSVNQWTVDLPGCMLVVVSTSTSAGASFLDIFESKILTFTIGDMPRFESKQTCGGTGHNGKSFWCFLVPAMGRKKIRRMMPKFLPAKNGSKPFDANMTRNMVDSLDQFTARY